MFKAFSNQLTQECGHLARILLEQARSKCEVFYRVAVCIWNREKNMFQVIGTDGPWSKDFSTGTLEFDDKKSTCWRVKDSLQSFIVNDIKAQAGSYYKNVPAGESEDPTKASIGLPIVYDGKFLGCAVLDATSALDSFQDVVQHLQSQLSRFTKQIFESGNIRRIESYEFLKAVESLLRVFPIDKGQVVLDTILDAFSPPPNGGYKIAGAIYTRTEDGILRLTANRFAFALPNQISPADDLINHVCAKGKLEIFPGYDEKPIFQSLKLRAIDGARNICWLIAPIRTHDPLNGNAGVLILARNGTDRNLVFDLAEQDEVSRITSLFARFYMTFQRRRFSNALQELRHNLAQSNDDDRHAMNEKEILNEMWRILNRELGRSGVLYVVSDRQWESNFSTQECFIDLYGKTYNGGQWKFAQASGAEAAVISKLLIRYKERGKACFSDFVEFTSQSITEDGHCLIAVPIIKNSEFFGAIFIQREIHSKPSLDELRFVFKAVGSATKYLPSCRLGEIAKMVAETHERIQVQLLRVMSDLDSTNEDSTSLNGSFATCQISHAICDEIRELVHSVFGSGLLSATAYVLPRVSPTASTSTPVAVARSESILIDVFPDLPRYRELLAFAAYLVKLHKLTQENSGAMELFEKSESSVFQKLGISERSLVFSITFLLSQQLSAGVILEVPSLHPNFIFRDLRLLEHELRRSFLSRRDIYDPSENTRLGKFFKPDLYFTEFSHDAKRPIALQNATIMDLRTELAEITQDASSLKSSKFDTIIAKVDAIARYNAEMKELHHAILAQSRNEHRGVQWTSNLEVCIKELVTQKFGAYANQIEVEPASEALSVRSSRAEVHRIVTQVLRNALDRGGVEMKVSFRTLLEPGFVAVTVRNRRSVESVETNVQSTGLGYTIARYGLIRERVLDQWFEVDVIFPQMEKSYEQ